MNTDKELKLYLRERINTIIRAFSTPALDRTPETFHKLRVEIKKLRAFYLLINFINKKFKQKKFFEPFKVLFKRAGEVRKLQIEEQLITTYKLSKQESQLLNAIKKKEKQAIKDFEVITGKKTAKSIDKTGEEVEGYLKKVTAKDLTKYQKKAIQETGLLVAANFSEAHLHEARKQLKEFLYNLKLFVPANDKLIKEMDKLQQMIGDWHDSDAPYCHLTKALPALTQKNAASKIKIVIKKLSSKNKRFIKKIDKKRKEVKRLIKSYKINPR